MSQTVQIASTAQFNALLKSSKVVVADCESSTAHGNQLFSSLNHLKNCPMCSANATVVYADWCGPCKAIAPAYEKRSSELSRKNLITFTKVNTESQQELAAQYNITR